MRVNNVTNSYFTKNVYSNRLNNDNSNTSVNSVTGNSPSFKGGGWSEKFSDFISKLYAEYYAMPMLKKEWLYKMSKKMANVPGKMTAHMATLGSLITSSVYVERTLRNKDLDNEKKKTLAINQGLCFLVPTACAYLVDHLLRGNIKDKEYRYSGRQLAKVSKKMGNMSDAQIKDFNKLMGDRLKGFSTLATLATFTLIYRYATPVIITPIANWLGEKLNESQAKKAAEEAKQKQQKLGVSAKKVA